MENLLPVVVSANVRLSDIMDLQDFSRNAPVIKEITITFF